MKLRVFCFAKLHRLHVPLPDKYICDCRMLAERKTKVERISWTFVRIFRPNYELKLIIENVVAKKKERNKMRIVFGFMNSDLVERQGRLAQAYMVILLGYVFICVCMWVY